MKVSNVIYKTSLLCSLPMLLNTYQYLKNHKITRHLDWYKLITVAWGVCVCVCMCVCVCVCVCPRRAGGDGG
jgi:hypothetical protein